MGASPISTGALRITWTDRGIRLALWAALLLAIAAAFVAGTGYLYVPLESALPGPSTPGVGRPPHHVVALMSRCVDVGASARKPRRAQALLMEE